MNRLFPNNDITSKIDKLVLKFCDTSVQCDSLNSLHNCMENVLNDGYDVKNAYLTAKNEKSNRLIFFSY